MDQDATWYRGRPQPRPHCVRWGPSSTQKGAQQPFKRLDRSGCHLVWRYTSALATLCQMGTQLPLPMGHSPQFSAHVSCGQTVGWIKMPHGMEVDLGPGHIVLDGDPASPQRGTAALPLLFRPISIVAKRLPISATAELL